MRRLIFPATRAVEHATALPGVVPLRMFPVLWPLWQVETSADIYDRQKYDVIDHFIVRAIDEAGINDRERLVAFLRLPPGMIDRCLAFLRLIGHIMDSGPALQLTELGRMSVQAGIRYVAKTSRQTILIERQTGWPLPRAYYDPSVRVLDTPEIEEGQLADRTRFLRVFTLADVQPQLLTWLENHPDRASFNLPSQLRNLRELGRREGFLPSYLVETADGRILAYSSIGEQRDEFLEKVCTQTNVQHRITAQGIRDPEETWRAWIAQTPAFGSGRLHREPNGPWRVVLDASAFGEPPKVSLSSMGTYRFRDYHILQIWCAAQTTRQVALRQRVLGIATLPEITSEAQLMMRMRDVAAALRVPELTMKELRNYAESRGERRRLDRLST